MSEELKTLAPKEVWNHFYSLTRIPRPSKHEEKIQQFMLQFGLDLGLESFRDEVGNIIIRKPATPGMEDRKGIILQAHLDMVPQKNSATQHDFEKDPIQAYIDGEWVKARGTTLGSDNGIGAAAIMTVLASKDLAHGPIEALFTCDEETGMTGAEELKPGVLHGDILLNLDSEDEGELYIGCAGGVDVTADLPYRPSDVPAGYAAFRISLTGLRGGHSGLDINLGRGNANKILVNLLQEAYHKTGARLASFEGGNLRNAIPREAFATVVAERSHAGALKSLVAAFLENSLLMFREADPELNLAVAETDMPAAILDAGTQEKFYHAIGILPNGMISMIKDVENVVETSTNLAIIKTSENSIFIACLLRSAVDQDKMDLADKMSGILKDAGARTEIAGAYPGWKPNFDSLILETMKQVYKRKYGKVPEVKVIHAGLECGILGSKYPHWDMISFGPTIRHPHSPDEKVNIATVGMFWDYLSETLKHAPAK